MDKNCGNTNFETFLPDEKVIYVPSKEERQLGDFGYADEDDPRKLGWCGEAIDDDEQDVVVENHGITPFKKVTEKELDSYVDQTGYSYFEAYKHFNVTSDDIEWESLVAVAPKKVDQESEEKIGPSFDAENLEDISSDDEPGPSVNLNDRHLAIQGLMSIYNLQSKNQGAHLHGFDRLADKYGYDEADRIIRNMDHNSEIADGQIDSHIETLMATTALRNAGFNMNDIMHEKEVLRSNLQHSYGPGNAHSADREKLVRKVRSPQDKVRHSHKHIADDDVLPF